MRTDRFVVGVGLIAALACVVSVGGAAGSGGASSQMLGCIETRGDAETRRDFKLRDGPPAALAKSGLLGRRAALLVRPVQLVPLAQPVPPVRPDQRAKLVLLVQADRVERGLRVLLALRAQPV